MKGIRGRYGQMKVLERELASTVNLPEIRVFSKENLNSAIERQQDIIIKPLIGPQELRVDSVNNSSTIVVTDNNQHHFVNREEVYEYLVELALVKKHYVIQTVPENNTTVQQYHRFTLHRISSSANWKVVHHTLIDRNGFERIRYAIPIWKAMKLVKTVACILGKYYPTCNTTVIEVMQNKLGELWITDTVLHERNSKWSQYLSLYSDKALRRYIPRTELFTNRSLKKLLKLYKQVILKPCIGQQGKGIVKISVLDDKTYEIHDKRKKTIEKNFIQLLSYLQEHYLNENDYIVQQYINIAKIDDRPFDVRVMTQLNEKEWIVTGKLVKVAAREYFISNRASKLLTLEEALRLSESRIPLDKSIFLIDEICRKASVIFANNYKGITIIGFDVATDNSGAVWIIEGNFAPSISMFYKFDGNKPYENIYKYIIKNKKRISSLSNREEEKT